MKTLKSLLYALAATVLLAGCSDDETYTAGEQENPDCYGVYFPSQANIADRELDPADEPALSFTVRRTKSEGEITVPVTVTSAQGDDIFEATAIEFADGQEETTFVISFPDTEIGTTYTCEVNVDDPLYASTYTERSTGFGFSITRVKWVLVTGPNGETTGKWRDEFITELFKLGDEGETPYAEKDVEIYERADKPGYYRIKDIYDAAFVTTLFGKLYSDTLPVPTNIIIDATKDVTDADVAGVVSDKTSVYFPAQSMGFQYTSQFDEDFWIVSYCKENYPTSSADEYGEIKDGILSFPDKAILLTLPSIWEQTSYYATNTSMTRLIFPGFKAYDYSLVLKNAEPADGEIKIGVKFGADVAKVKYAFFEGELSDALADIRSGEIESGETASQELTATGTLTASFEATGVYSIVANVYNAKNELVGVEHLSFGYVKAGDEEETAVVISCGITITNKYAPQGYTTENSAEIYIYGQNIVSGSYALIKTDRLPSNLATYMEKNGNAFDKDDLEKINDLGLSGVIGNLFSGTEYTLIIKAFNGYVSKLITATATTEGTFQPFEYTYTAADMAEIEGGKTELFKSWNLWARNYYDTKNTNRQPWGQATFSENTEDDVDDGEDSVDAINVKGMSFGESETDDTVVWEYYNDVFYTLGKQVMGSFTYNGSTLYLMPTYIDVSSGMGTPGNNAMVGGIVADGYMALVSNHPTYNFSGMLFQAYSDAEATNAIGNWAFYYDIMFEDPAVAGKAASAAVVKAATHSFRELALNVSTPNNFVELRGRERMHALIDEMKANKNARNFAETLYPVEMPALGAVEATTSFEAGMRLQRGSIDTRIADKALRVR